MTALAHHSPVAMIYQQLCNPRAGAFRSCALCTHGDERGQRCYAPQAHAGLYGMPAADARGSTGPCGPHGVLLELEAA